MRAPAGRVGGHAEATANSFEAREGRRAQMRTAPWGGASHPSIGGVRDVLAAADRGAGGTDGYTRMGDLRGNSRTSGIGEAPLRLGAVLVTEGLFLALGYLGRHVHLQIGPRTEEARARSGESWAPRGGQLRSTGRPAHCRSAPSKATTLRHHVRLTTAARARAVAGLDEATRAALEAAEEKVLEDAQPLEDNVVALVSRRR